jgi:hypothetical protein
MSAPPSPPSSPPPEPSEAPEPGQAKAEGAAGEEAAGSAAPAEGGVSRLSSWAASRRDKAERNWRFLDAELQRTRLLTKVVLLHARYTFGYLAFGFLVSAPIQLGMRHEAGWTEGLVKSIVLGVLFALPCLLLWPLTIIDWHRMRIPEFKNLELALTRWAAIAAGVWLAACFVFGRVLDVGGWTGWLLDLKVAWTNLGLMFFSWVRVKFHTVMFREFYTLKPDDDLVLRVPPSKLKVFGEQKASTPAEPTPPPATEEIAAPAPEPGGDAAGEATEASDEAPVEAPSSDDAEPPKA